MQDFLDAVRAKKLDRIAAAYAVGGWVLAQAADIALPTFGAPGWVLKTFIAILFIGFPVVIGIAWVATPHPGDKPAAATGTDRALLGLLALVAAAVAGQAIYTNWPSSLARSDATASMTALPAQGKHVIRSIAVLPLDNYTGDPKQIYFVDGMTDELTTDLARISKLRVISRGSVMQFQGSHRPPTPEIAKLLDVDAVVEGSVMRAGDRVRITVQLIDAREDKHLWAQTFEHDSRDVFKLQAELTRAIAQAINVQLTPGEKKRLKSARTVNPAAHDAYLKGRYFFNRPNDENLKKAIDFFQQAIQLDPTFAPAYSGLSDAVLWEGYNEGFMTAADAEGEAKAAADKAVELDPGSAEAHTSLANYLLWYKTDWAGSEREYRRAIALNPNYAFAHDQFGMGLALQGRLDEGIAESAKAINLDPLSPQIQFDAAFAYVWAGKFEKARALAETAENLDPNYAMAPFVLGWSDVQQGKYADAIAYFRKARANNTPAYVTAYLGYAEAKTGDRKAALAVIDDLKARAIDGYVPAINLAIVYIGLGDDKRALDYLDEAAARHSQFLVWLKMEKIYDPLRKDPRFIALMKKANFIE